MNTRLFLFGIGLMLTLTISTWTPVVIISTHPDNIYSNRRPEIAVDLEGNSYVTWEGHDGNDREVYWVKIDASGTPGTVQKISTHPDNMTTDDWLPQIVVDGRGTSYVTWGGADGNDHDIYWVKIDSSGTPGRVENISDYREDIEFNEGLPQIAVDAEGNSYITWEGSDGNDLEIYWVKIDPSGAVGTIRKISTHPDNASNNDYDPKIDIDASGNSYVVWHGCDKNNCWKEPGDLEIYWVKIDASGIPGTVQKIPPTDPDNIDTMAMIPQIAVDASGNSYIVWSGKNEESNDIYWIRIDASGILGTVKRILNYPDLNYEDYNPQIALDASGTSYITWENLDKNGFDIYWVKIDSSGEPGEVRKVSNYLGSVVYDDSCPQVAVDGKGNSYVTWLRFNKGFAEHFDLVTCWVKIDASGTPGRIQNISSRQESKHFDQDPQIAVDGKGNSYVTWRGEDASKNDHIYLTARLPNHAISRTVTIIIFIVIMVVIAVVIAMTYKLIRRIFLRNRKKENV